MGIRASLMIPSLPWRSALGGRFDICDRNSLPRRPGRRIDLCCSNPIDPGRVRSHWMRGGDDFARRFHGRSLVGGKPGCGSGRVSRRRLCSEFSRACRDCGAAGSTSTSFLNTVATVLTLPMNASRGDASQGNPARAILR
jgi:hypothetical protein